MSKNQKKLPWMIETPLRRSRFKSLHLSGQKFNVETDFSRIATYDLSRSKDRMVVESDLQFSEGSTYLRLGAGRSGFYLNQYLKGIGRTMLSANWNSVEDRNHGSGYLQGSSGVREYVTSRYLKQLKIDHTIVPCSQLLMKKIQPNQAKQLKRTIEEAGVSIKIEPIDLNFQAITVKDGDFIRLSNLLWLMDATISGEGRIRFSEFMEIFIRAFEPVQKNRDRLKTPSQIIELVEKRFFQLLDHHHEYFRNGIYWTSFDNNFSADSRFIDIEVPLFIGGPVPGVFMDENPQFAEMIEVPFERFIPFSFYDPVLQFRNFIDRLTVNLKYWQSHSKTEALEKKFIGSFIEELHSVFDRDHVIHSVEKLIESRLSKINSALGFDLVSFLSSHSIKIDFKRCMLVGEKGRFKMNRVNLELASHESCDSISLFAPGSPDQFDGVTRKAVSINHFIKKLDQTSDMKSVFKLLKKLPRFK